MGRGIKILLPKMSNYLQQALVNFIFFSNTLYKIIIMYVSKKR